MVPNILGFHTNTTEKAKEFVEESKMIFYSDKQYLGYGMYFWDNLGNAKYWANKKLRESGGTIKEVQICTANILLDDPILDLTDVRIIATLRELWLAYCKKQGEKRVKQYLGTIIDILREFFPEMMEMKVAKCHGDYSHYTKNKFLVDLGDKAYIDNRPRTIYSVICETKVKDPKYLELVIFNK